MASSKTENIKTVVESSPSSDERITCQICFTPYGSINPEGHKESGVLTPCGHIFGGKCLQVWKNSTPQLTCPMCRVLLEYRQCSHPIMPLPMSLSETIKPILSTAFPSLCIDCEHTRLQSKLWGDWLKLLDSRYAYGRQALKFLMHWQSNDISSEDPSWESNINTRINNSLKNMATDDELAESSTGGIKEGATTRDGNRQRLVAEGDFDTHVTAENNNIGQPTRAESLDVHVSIEREPTPSPILGNGGTDTFSEAISEMDSVTPQPRSQGQSPDQDLQDTQSSSRSETTEQDETMDEEDSETDDGGRSDYDYEEEESDDDLVVREGSPESKEAVLAKVQTYNDMVLSFLRNSRRVLQLLRDEREKVEENPTTWRLVFDQMKD